MLNIKNLTVKFTDKELLTDISMHVATGASSIDRV